MLESTKESLTLGSLCIDFGITEGDVRRRSFAFNPVIIRRREKAFKTPPALQNVIRSSWPRLCEDAKRRRQKLVDGPLMRLVAHSRKADALHLTLQPTSYRVFATTNLQLDSLVDLISRVNPRISVGDVRRPISAYLANPLNIIAMVVTADNFTITPWRSSSVIERPNTWQASVGGAIEPSDKNVSEALRRECEEELGFKPEEEEMRFIALGINQKTLEPDLIALIETRQTLGKIMARFASQARFEFQSFESARVNEEDLPTLVSALRTKEWSQPSDQAAFLLMLANRLGAPAVEEAFRQLGA